MILDSEGQLRIIDWDEARFYPESFEHGGMHNFIARDWTKFDRWRWKLLAWIVGRLYDKVLRWLERHRREETIQLFLVSIADINKTLGECAEAKQPKTLTEIRTEFPHQPPNCDSPRQGPCVSRGTATTTK
ncbi:hypothetical protein E4U30_002000 [Claviceps sp. LM220 group G6]|nr:hypothetical protein E4U30_002000 [Claviceps sp. LM220 group G6]